MRVTLNEADHIYTDDRGQIYKSVSGIIAEYKQPFDAQKIEKNGKTLISNYAEKNGESEQYWLDLWAGKRDYACEKGHAFHTLKELIVNSQAVHKTLDGIFMPVRNIELEWGRIGGGMFGQLAPGVYTEMILWNYLAKTAGTADLVTIYPDKTFDIDDYKTNGTFKTEGFKGKCMKFPCTHLGDCHLGHYTLQLTLYAWMLSRFGLTPKNLRLHHYDIPDKDVEKILNEGILPDIEPTIYPVVYEDQIAKIIFNNRTSYIKNIRR